MAAGPEAKVKQKIRRRIAKISDRAWVFMPVQTGFGMTGVPDLLICHPITITKEMVGQTIGAFAAIEAKAKGGRTTARQDYQIASIARAGGRVMVIEGEEAVDDGVAALLRWS